MLTLAWAMAKKGDTDKVGLGALAALVVLLGVIVWLALPKDGDREAAGDAGPRSGVGVEGGTASDEGGAPPKNAALERLPEATSELAVLTDKPEIEVAKVASAEAIAKMLDVRHCGATCDAIRKVIVDHEHFEVEVMKSEDYILPPKDSFETIASGMTPAERATIGQRPSTVVIRTHGVSTIDQLPARTAFAARCSRQ